MNLSLTRGDTATLTIPLLDGAASYTPPAGSSAVFSIKRRLTDPDASALVQKSTASGTITFSGTNALVSILNVDTRNIDDRNLFYDVQVQTLAGRVLTAALGMLTLTHDVTRLTATAIPVFSASPVPQPLNVVVAATLNATVQAVPNTLYIMCADTTFTDPTPPFEGAYFEVIVRSGQPVMGGLPMAAIDVGTRLVRIWHSGGWQTYGYERTL